MAATPFQSYAQGMEEYNGYQGKNVASPMRSTATAALIEKEIGFAPWADEVATRTRFSQAKHGLQPWLEVQRWLAAEAEFIAQHHLTRVHRFQNQTLNSSRSAS
jgi:hypothetical protein